MEKSPNQSDARPIAFDETAKEVVDVEIAQISHALPSSAHLQRRLRSKEVQLFAIGGAIGTGLFLQMGAALPKGGPGGLLLGFVIWGVVMLCINECFAELVCYAPIPSPFVRLAGVWVDEALAFAMSWNFFLNMALLVPYEIVAFNILLGFWTDAIPVEAVIVTIMVSYAVLNTLSVRYFGVAEFYLSIFKVFLIFMCLSFTLVTMCGGNPLHDAYGFRYWKDPGAFVEHLVPGSTGKFLGVLSCVVQATFSITGPEYISMVAGETESPRTVLPKAYRAFVWRIMFFFIASALALGIVIPYNDSTLLAVLSGEVGGSGTGAASPYVIAMDRLKISGLPHLVNALIMTSVLSCGNGIFFSASRTLYGMSLNGTAPRLFSKTWRSGVPVYAVLACLGFCCLAFLQVRSSSAQVLIWLVYLITACQLLNYFSVALTYRQFHAALQSQGVNRQSLPYRGKFQPHAAYVAMFGCGLMLLLLGFDLFVAGGWDITYFFLDYTFLVAFPLAFVVWKLLRKTKIVKPSGADLSVGGLVHEIDEYEKATDEIASSVRS